MKMRSQQSPSAHQPVLFAMLPVVRRTVSSAALTALLALLAAGCGPSSRPLAKVDGNVVTRGEWLRHLYMRRGGRELLAMIDEIIIQQEAEKLGIKPTQEQVRAKLDQVIATLGSREALEQRLRDLGMSMEELMRRVRILATLDEIVRKHIKVSESEMWRYYQAHRKQFTHGAMVRARIMLFSDKSSAEAVLSALKAGGDFAGLAKALSEDPATSSSGGDTGWFEYDDYAPQISKVAFSLKPSQLSGVFKGPDGWYILKVEGRRPPGQIPYEQVREQIEARLIQEKLLDERFRWLVEKRQSAGIVIKDRRLAQAVKALMNSTPPPPALPGLMTPEQMFAGVLGQR